MSLHTADKTTLHHYKITCLRLFKNKVIVYTENHTKIVNLK
jgi:hypothetical protein